MLEAVKEDFFCWKPLGNTAFTLGMLVSMLALELEGTALPEFLACLHGILSVLPQDHAAGTVLAPSTLCFVISTTFSYPASHCQTCQ